jgi:AcrR family transcriptional regulator
MTDPTTTTALTTGLITGTFSLLSVWLGSRATLVTARLTAGTQRGQLEAARRDSQREACTIFLTSVLRYFDRARDLAIALEERVPAADLADQYQRYLDQWHEVYVGAGAVEIAVPELVDASSSLRGALGDVANVCEAWYKARLAGPTNSRRGMFDQAEAALGEAKGHFVETAARALAQPDPAAGRSRQPLPRPRPT